MEINYRFAIGEVAIAVAGGIAEDQQNNTITTIRTRKDQTT